MLHIFLEDVAFGFVCIFGVLFLDTGHTLVNVFIC